MGAPRFLAHSSNRIYSCTFTHTITSKRMSVYCLIYVTYRHPQRLGLDIYKELQDATMNNYESLTSVS